MSMSEHIDRETTLKVAHLSRIQLDEASGARLAAKLSAIVAAFRVVGGIPVSAHADIKPGLGREQLREDEARASLGQARALAPAPLEFKGHFRVPPVIQ